MITENKYTLYFKIFKKKDTQQYADPKIAGLIKEDLPFSGPHTVRLSAIAMPGNNNMLHLKTSTKIISKYIIYSLDRYFYKKAKRILRIIL